MLRISTYCGGIAQTNGYLVETPEESFVVDAPDGMAQWLRERGAKVGTLLLTHQHFDHVLAAAAIQRDFGARVYAFAPFSRKLTLEFLLGFVSGSSFEVPEFTVDVVVEARGEVMAGGVSWKLAHIPGHSADSITFYSAEQGLVFGGDVLFSGSIGRTDFPGGSLETLLEGILRELLVLPDETRVLPGHGPETTVGEERLENPYLE